MSLAHLPFTLVDASIGPGTFAISMIHACFPLAILLSPKSETKLQGRQKNVKLQEAQLVEQLTIIGKNIL
jgi:hypothetical protein